MAFFIVFEFARRLDRLGFYNDERRMHGNQPRKLRGTILEMRRMTLSIQGF